MGNSGKVSLPTALLVLAFTVPIALTVWMAYITTLQVVSGDPEREQIPPTRWLLTILLPVVLVLYGLRRKSLSCSGAAIALVVGFVLTLSNYCFVSDLLTFFLSSSRLTKFRSKEKKLFEEEFKEGGQRNWIQVICNGGMATLLAALYLTDVGVGETPIDFVSQYRASWLSLGVMGAFACCNGDTWASEVGSVVGGQPFLITTGRKVPRGTNGGVSIGGLVCSFTGGLIVGIAHYLTVLYCVDEALLRAAGAQWPVILVGALAGFFGSLLDSLLGATLQYSGVDKKSRCIVEHPGPNVQHISGARLLDNHSVNLISSVAAGILTPILTHALWL